MRDLFKSYFSNLSVKTKLLVSYILLFTIPLFIIGLFGYEWIANTVSDYAQKAYTNILEKTINENDGIFTQLDTLTNQLSNTTWVREITYMQGDTIDESRVDAWTKMGYAQDMKALQSSMATVSDLGILFVDKNAVIASYGSSDIKFMAQNAFHIDGMDVADWVKMTKDLKMGESLIFPAKILTKYNVSSKGFVYIRPIAYNLDTKYRSVLFAFIRQQSFDENIKTLFIDDGISVSISDKSKLPFLIYGPATSTNSINISLNSPRTNWKYSMSIPRWLLTENAEKMRNFILLLDGMLFAICIMIAFGFMRNIYKPISELIAVVRKNISENHVMCVHNEYSWLQDGIHAMVEQENILKNELESRKPILQDVWLEKLITGRIEPLQEFVKALAMLEIDMPHQYWRVCIVTGRKEHECNSNSLWLINYIADKNSMKLESLVIYACCSMEYNSILLNFNSETDFLSFINQFTIDFPETIISIGNSYQLLNDVSKSYQDAISTLKYMLIKQDCQIIWPNDVNANRDCYFYPIDMEYKILSCLKSGDAQTTITLFRSLLTNNLNQQGVSFESLNNLLTNIQLTAIKSLEEAGIVNNEIIKDIKNSLHNPFKITRDVPRISKKIEDIFVTICNLIIEKNAAYPTIHEEIIHYVDSSITNSSLSLAMIADRFNVSISYISRIFTENMGKNYHLYINEKRIAMARDLILEKPDITSVARSIGYDSDVTFRRAFKQYTGLSPSDFRSQHKKESKKIQ
jgi:two-component system, response regulator YesN